ncbi:hypothetical protein [Gemmiger formicilis]|uniref:hypothetical protein n=1 Tax=Gemmiger formicilis TaxID=745368 RepID=UPI003522B8CE
MAALLRISLSVKMYLTCAAGIETYCCFDFWLNFSMYLTRDAGIETHHSALMSTASGCILPAPRELKLLYVFEIFALYVRCILPAPYLRESNKNTPTGMF